MHTLVNAWHDESNRDARALGANRTANGWYAIKARIDDLKEVYSEAAGVPMEWDMRDEKTGNHVQVLQ